MPKQKAATDTATTDTATTDTATDTATTAGAAFDAAAGVPATDTPPVAGGLDARDDSAGAPGVQLSAPAEQEADAVTVTLPAAGRNGGPHGLTTFSYDRCGVSATAAIGTPITLPCGVYDELRRSLERNAKLLPFDLSAVKVEGAEPMGGDGANVATDVPGEAPEGSTDADTSATA